MKVTVERSALLKALGHAGAVVKRKNTIPVLSNVLIEAGQQVEIALDGDRLALVSGRSRYRLAVIAAHDFPKMQPAEDSVSFSWPTAELRGMIGKVAHAQSTDMARFFLNGTCLEAHAGALFLTATDGFCVASASCDAPEGATEIGSHIIPRETVSVMADLLSDAEGDAEVTISAKQLRLGVGELVLTSKLIDGTFPDWRRVIPAGNPHRLTITREAFAGAVRRAVVVNSDKVRWVTLELSPDKLTVRTLSPEHGEAAEEAPALWEAAELEMKMNAKFMTDTLAAMGGHEIEVRLENSGAPALFTNPEDTTAQWVVMPMR
jgi:DNA polymerase-3 subunit beta